MHDYASLTRDLEKMGLSRSGTTLAHTSMKAIGAVEGGADTVLDVFMDYFGGEGLFAMPCLSWVLCLEKDPVFDVQNTPSCIGLLPEMFRKREGVVRSWHPTHSTAAFGKDAQAFEADDHKNHTPCGFDSSWHKLIARDATILQVGCTLTSCTFLHGVEEWCGIEGRLDTPVRYKVVPPEGEAFYTESQPHLGTPSEQFYRLEDALLASGALRFAPFGDAKVYVLSAKKTFETAQKVLAEKPRLFDE